MLKIKCKPKKKPYKLITCKKIHEDCGEKMDGKRKIVRAQV